MTDRVLPVRLPRPRPRRGLHWRKRQAPALLSVLAAILIGVGSASADSIQSKRAEAQRVLEQVHQLDLQLEKASEAYNLANIQLAQIDTDLRENARHLVIAESSLRNAQSHLAQRLIALYVNGQSSSTLEILLGSESMDDLMNRLDTAQRVSEQDAQVLAEVRRFKADVKARKVRLDHARSEQTKIVAARSSRKQWIESQLAREQRLRASIQGEIARLEAAERRRQAQLAAAARARLTGLAQVASETAPAPAFGGFAADPVDPNVPLPPARYTGVVGIAMQYLGTPYVWGGASPAGFDCSGFIMYVYGQVGVSLPHHAASQYGYGTAVPRDALEPGDLVFFDGLGHAGIYIGGGQFIHSPHTGDVVKISSLSESWYASTYVGARRL